MHLGGINRFCLRQVRKNGGQTLGDHGFSGAGRPYHEQVVSTRRGHLEGTFDLLLAFDIVEIDLVVATTIEKPLSIQLVGCQQSLTRDKIPRLTQGLHSVNLQAFDHRSFRRILSRHDQTVPATPFGLKCHGQHTTYWPHHAI